MPVASIRGVGINYEILGRDGPWLALSPGGRRGLVSVRSLGEKLAEAGHRVVVYDRRNCGASDVAIEGDSENDIWADDLYELLAQLDALPAYIGGSSSGCRLSMLLALRHPAAVRALLLWRVTGGAYAAQRLIQNYYTLFIDAARTGGMEAVCATEHFAEVIRQNPANRERLMAMTPERFIAALSRWRDSFKEGTEHPVIGVSAAELRGMTLPTCIVPGNDRVHPRGPGQAAHRLMPNSEYHEVLTEDRMDVDVAFEDWDAKEGLLAAVFIDYLRRLRRRD
jgi:pimeloyl-ACP methyl ester carboxylesterase